MRYKVTLILIAGMLYANNLTFYDIDKLLNSNNPYVKAIEAKFLEYRAKSLYAKGELDTKLFSHYEYKEYPLSFGKFLQTGVLQGSKNGMEFSLSYRKAEGVQEYNNIKTGKRGEYLAKLKISLVEFLNGIGKKGYIVEKAHIRQVADTLRKKMELLELKVKVKKLYFSVLEAKWKVLFYEELLELTKKNKELVKKGVKKGLFPHIDLLEIEAAIEAQKERFYRVKGEFENKKRALFTYLNIKNYTIKAQIYSYPRFESYEVTLKMAKSYLPHIKAIREELRLLDLEKRYLKNRKFPTVEMSLYKNYDISYQKWGDKIGIDVSYPLQNIKYKAKKEEYRAKELYFGSLLKKSEMELEGVLKDIEKRAYFLQKEIEAKRKRVKLYKKLVQASVKKYKMGLGSLFLVLKRERELIENQIGLYSLIFEANRLRVELDSLSGRI